MITAPAAPAATDRKRKRGSDAAAADSAVAAASSSPVAAAAKPESSRASVKKKAASARASDDSAMIDAPEAAASVAASSTSAKKPKPSPKKKGKSKANAVAAAALLEASDGFKFGTLSRDFERALTTEGKGVHFVGVDEAGRGPLAGPVVCAAVWAPLDRVDIKGVNDSKKMSEEERERVYAELTSHPSVVWSTAILEHDEIDRINILEATMRGMERAVAGVVAKMDAAREEAAATTSGKKKQASSAAATAAVLPASLDLVLVDGNRIPPGLGATAPAPLAIPAMFVIKGDALCYSIAAASVIAKVTRDRIMMQHHETWPHYNFAQHKVSQDANAKGSMSRSAHGGCSLRLTPLFCFCLVSLSQGYGVGAHMSAIYKHGPCPIHRMTFAPMKHMKAKAAAVAEEEEAAAEEAADDVEAKAAPAAKKRKASVTKKAAVPTKPTKKATKKKAAV